MAELSFSDTDIPGLTMVSPSMARDERGAFGRPFSQALFDQARFDFKIDNANIAWNHKRLTLRGMHFQDETAPETKLVFPVEGSVFDVIVDVRPGSDTFGKWQGFTLDARDPIGLLIPPLCAHGYLTLTEDAHLMYLMDVPYAPDASKGLRYNEPAVGIDWPFPPKMISERDATLPLLGDL